jgi:hypothetical protein
MNAQEKRIFKILEMNPFGTSAWDEPINAIVKATGMTTLEARRHATNLRDRGILLPFSIVTTGRSYDPKLPRFRWARP